MQTIFAIAILAVLIIGALAASAFWPSVFAVSFRDMFRSWPEAKTAFVASGRWIAVSKRFGWPYVAGLLLFPFIWLPFGMRLVPDTTTGAWLLFGPCFFSLPVGVALGGLRVMRWIADEA